jgi:hypothetical protein
MKTTTETTLSATVTCLILSAFVVTSFANAKALPPHPLFGVTIENLETFDTNQLRELIKDKSLPLTVRVIFQNEMLPADYLAKLEEIDKINLAVGKKIFVMGTLYDSEYLDDYKIKKRLEPEDKLACDKLKRKSTDYQLRTFCFVDKLSRFVDIWEVGNEVNGEWADEGCKEKDGECESKYDEEQNKHVPKSKAFPERTIAKIAYAIELALKKDKPTALTLLHQPNCTTWDDNDMFKWSKANITDYIRSNTDYLLVSYYEYNCNKGDGTQGKNYWKEFVFDELRKPIYFPNAYLGFGEVGYPSETVSCLGGVSFCDKKTGIEAGKKIPLMEKYYSVRVADNPKYIGGYFWWTFQQDIDCSDGNTNCGNFYRAVDALFK